MEDRLVDILDQSLERLNQGATVEECLAAFPGERAELELPLKMAGQLRALPHPQLPAATRVALEQTMLDLAARRRINQAANQATPSEPAPRPPWRMLEPAVILAGFLRMLGYRGSLRQPWLRLAALALTIVLALVLSAGTFAAARALISIARPQPTAAPPTAPTATPTAAPNATPIVLDGQIDQLAQERWVVGGRAVILTASTTISGTPALNAIAHVRGGLASGGALLALQIAIDPIAATPSATPSATASATPPTPTLTRSPTPEPTAIPTAVPADPPAPVPQPAAPIAPPPTAAPPPPGDDQQHVCQGQQRGRDDKKCDPKPKKPNEKHNKDKKDKKHG
jgi:hypothetical protein